MIDINKQYQTRDGRTVRIISTEGPKDRPVVAIITHPDPNFNEQMVAYQTDGRPYKNLSKTCLDLIEAPKKFRYERWVNVYDLDELDDQVSDLYISKEEADHYADPSRIACVKVIIEGVEGEGL